MTQQYDIVVVGGGMVGLTMAVALARYDFKVAVIESKPPTLTWDASSFDARVCAINETSKRMLQRLGVWPTLRAEYMTAVEQMQVWDELGGGEINFTAVDTDFAQLATIVENRELVRALWDIAQSLVQIYSPSQVATLAHQADAVTLQLEDETVLSARLVIGADGAHSWLRQQLNTPVVTRPYFQQAIIAVMKAELPHRQTALQNFLSTGPLGLLPLADPHHSVLIWSADDWKAEQLMKSKEKAFNCAVANGLSLRCGRMTLASERHVIPLMMRHAKQYWADRAVLVGDAAHTIHPLAGQGVNLGFMDVGVLLQALLDARAAGHDFASARALRWYERRRHAANQQMILAMRGFKEAPAFLRSQSFSLAQRFSILKKYFISNAQGRREELHWLYDETV